MVPMGNCVGEQSPEKKMRIGREPITFIENDLEGTVQPHDDVLVVTARISSFLVKRAMVDQGSGADVMYPNLFKGLRLKSRDLSKYDTPLVEFDGRMVVPEGQISLPINMEGKEVMVAFIVVNSFSPYPAILGWSWIHTMGAIPSILYVKVKFPTEQGIIVVKGSRQVARQCLVATVNRKNEQVEQKGNAEEASLEQLQNPQEGLKAAGAKQLIRVKILPNVNRYFQIGASMKDEDKVEMLLFLLRNVDVFAWSPYEVLGVDPEFIVHKFNVNPSFLPKKQKPRRSAKEHVEVVR